MGLDKQTDREMKNPREEAQALVDKMFWKSVKTREQSIRASKVAVDEIIKVIDNNVHNDVSGLILKQHWHQVREELKLL